MTLTPGTLVRHTDGGYYRVLLQARHTDDQSPHVVYAHLWPFDAEGEPWVRPLSQWQSRFIVVSRDELARAMQSDRAQAQRAVTAAKAARRAAERRQP